MHLLMLYTCYVHFRTPAHLETAVVPSLRNGQIAMQFTSDHRPSGLLATVASVGIIDRITRCCHPTITSSTCFCLERQDTAIERDLPLDGLVYVVAGARQIPLGRLRGGYTACHTELPRARGGSNLAHHPCPSAACGFA